MNFKAVLFDLDGVVIDSNQGITAFWKMIAADYGVSLQESDFLQYIYGCPVRETLTALFPKLNTEERRAVHARLSAYETNLNYKAVPGVTMFLEDLASNRVPTALVTSSERWKVETVFKQLKLAELFTVLVTAEDIRHGKPDPECYRLAVERLGLAPEDCLVFEDALSGVRAAVKAGTHCIGVQRPEGARLLFKAGAFRVIPDFTVLEYRFRDGDGQGPGSLFIKDE